MKNNIGCCSADVIVKPLADGGEGTTEALVEGLGGKYVSAAVTGPLGEGVRPSERSPGRRKAYPRSENEAFRGQDVELKSGIDIVLEAVGLEQELKDADYVITWEGRLDHQTAMGKAPVGVARLAKKYGVKVFAFAGSVSRDASKCNAAGIDAFFPIVRGVTTLDEAMNPKNAKENMMLSAEQVFRAVGIPAAL